MGQINLQDASTKFNTEFQRKQENNETKQF